VEAAVEPLEGGVLDPPGREGLVHLVGPEVLRFLPPFVGEDHGGLLPGRVLLEGPQVAFRGQDLLRPEENGRRYRGRRDAFFQRLGRGPDPG
jgi:hypothetical protein